jgi:hypothetical protein
MAAPLLIFISYSRTDARELAMRLCEDLKKVGHRVWIDSAELEGGVSWSNEIQGAIDSCNVSLALLSAASYTSPICQAEQQYAIDLGKRLIPLLAQPKVRRPLYLYHLEYRDFSDPKRYADTFQQLVSDLAIPFVPPVGDISMPAPTGEDRGRTGPMLSAADRAASGPTGRPVVVEGSMPAAGPLTVRPEPPPSSMKTTAETALPPKVSPAGPASRPLSPVGPASRAVHVPAPMPVAASATSTSTADLMVALSRIDAERYFVELTFSRPDDRAERPPVRGPASFNFPALRAASLDTLAYGRLLNQAIFSQPEQSAFFSTALAVSQSDKLTLRLRLLIDPSAPELHELRWETLRSPQDDGFLATNESLLFSRYLYSTDWRRVTLRPRGEMRALVAVANPSNLDSYSPGGRSLAAVDVKGEQERARQGLRGVQVIDTLPEADGAAGQVSLDNLVERLRTGYDVLYLVCHGALFPKDRAHPDGPKEARLWLEKEDGSVSVATGSELVSRLGDLPPAIRPRLVVLAACQSGGASAPVADAASESELSTNDQGALAAIGPRLAEVGVPAVIAMQGDVLMSTVAAFMPVFFKELLKDGQLERAIAAGRSAVRDNPDWWAPVLYTRLKDGQLYMPGEALPVAGKLPPPNDLPAAGDLPTGSRLPYIRNAIFTGRRKELLALARHLLYAPPGSPRQVVITGMGGIGKSELAVEFCYRYGRFISGVHWIEATQNPMAEIAACGLAMGISPWPRSLPEQASATLQAWNLTAQRGERHLVVLDGVEEPGLLREWLPRLSSVQVLVTSKRSVWPRELGLQALDLDTTTPGDRGRG